MAAVDALPMRSQMTFGCAPFIAWSVGFGAQGGNRDQSLAENADGYALGRALRLSWRQKVSGGFFLRAETFFNLATYLEDVGSPFIAYGGKSLAMLSV